MAKKKQNTIVQPQAVNELVSLDIQNICVSGNPREYFNENALKELTESIKTIGIIQPITVRKTPNTENLFTIICGERRYRAAKLAGLTHISAYIRECTEDEALDMAMTENLQREDMTEVETAQAIKRMIEEKGHDVSTIAVKLGKSEKYVRDRVLLNNLIDRFKELLSTDVLKINKAVILSAYPVDLQEKILEEHFNDDYNSWAELPIKKFIAAINNWYNSNLAKAEFDTTECKQCPFNSSIGQLFEDEDAKCLKQSCYTDKNDIAKFSKYLKVIEENPTLPITTEYYKPSWLEKGIADNDLQIVDLRTVRYPSEPEKPEEPNLEDYTDEETGEVGEDFNDALEDYNSELAEYEESLSEYAKEVLEFEDKIHSGVVKQCISISSHSINIVYYYTSDDDVTEVDATSIEDQTISKLQAKLTREQELKVEKTITDLKDQVIKGSIDYTKEPIKLENDILFFYLISKLSSEHTKLFFGEPYADDKKKFDFILSMTAEQRTIIIRDYIQRKLREFAHNSTSVSSQLFLEFAKYHFEDETAKIELQYQEVFLKRKTKIDEKLKAAQASKMEAEEVTQEIED